MKKASEEFIKGKNNIGYVDSSFTIEFGNDELGEGKVLTSQKLTRTMTDFEILSELKIQECTVADILATMNAASEDMKDGYSNLFYMKDHPSRVVRVRWHGGEWDVDAWGREDVWDSGGRVFSLATFGAIVSDLDSDSVTLPDYCSCEHCPKCGKLVK